MKRRRKVMIAAAVLVVLTAGGLLAGRWNRQRQAHLAAAEVTQVKTVPVKRQNLINSISVTGTIKSVDARDVSASAREVKVLEVNCKVTGKKEIITGSIDSHIGCFPHNQNCFL